MRAVMYHYVRPGPDRPPFEYYYLDLDDFREQLDFLQETYDVVSREAFASIAAGETAPPEDAAVLTFDDGLVDHYEWVLPELRDRDLWGLFFVPGPVEGTLLPVHRVHVLLGVAPPDELVSALSDVVDERDVLDDGSGEFERIYEGSDDHVATFKRVLNYRLPYDRLSEVLDALEARFPEAAAVDPEDYYMTRPQLRELAEAGMVLGGHTVTHPVLSRLPPEDQREEVASSLAFVDDVVDGQPLRTFAYPYGTAETFDDDTIAALDAQGCDLAFTTEPDEVSAATFEDAPLRLPRRDCNEFPHGGASI